MSPVRRGPDRGSRLRTAVRDTGRAWHITRQATGWYHWIRELGGGDFLDWDFREITGLPGGLLTNQLAQSRIGTPMVPADDDTATYAGTWTHTYLDASTGYTPVAATGSISSASGALTLGSAVLSPSSVGRRMTIVGAGAAGANLDTTITAVSDSTHATVSPTASTTVAGATVTIWPGYRYSTTAGSTATWTSPSDATSIGLILVSSTNGGLHKVTVDGSATAATLLPTAQDVVTSGAYPNTILVANGGTLDPTDRVVDCYAASLNWTNSIAIVVGLSAAAHTVVLTATGYTHTSGTGSRAYITAFCAGSATTTPTTTNALTLSTVATLSGFSASEPVYRLAPTGFTPTYVDFLGRIHGYEAQVSLTLSIDGTPTTVAVGASATVPAGSVAVWTLTTTLRHPEVGAGATPVGNVTYVYTLDQEGLTIETTHTGLFDSNMTAGYAAMMPTDGRFDRYTSSGLHKRLTVNSGDGGQKGNAFAYLAVLWTSADKYAFSAELLNPAEALDSWQRSAPGHTYCEDRAPVSGTKTNKVYFSRVGSSSTPETVNGSTVLHAKTVYRFKRFPGGAEASLTSV